MIHSSAGMHTACHGDRGWRQDEIISNSGLRAFPRRMNEKEGPFSWQTWEGLMLGYWFGADGTGSRRRDKVLSISGRETQLLKAIAATV